MANDGEGQEPVVLKNGFKIYPWDVASTEKIGGAWVIYLHGTHVPLVITKPGNRFAYEQLERLLAPLEEGQEEEEEKGETE